MKKEILEGLQKYLKDNNVMICSSRGEISLLHDVHGPDRERLSTGRNSINAYDISLLADRNSRRLKGKVEVVETHCWVVCMGCGCKINLGDTAILVNGSPAKDVYYHEHCFDEFLVEAGSLREGGDNAGKY